MNIKERSPTSGLQGPGSGFIRKDPNSRNQDYHNVYLTTKEKMRAIFGLVIYVTIFIILIPIGLYKIGFITFLKIYFLNTDLIATVLSYNKGIFKNIFKYLYNDTGPLIGFISQSIINWSVLMGLFYIILNENKNKKVTYALSKVAFILFITYLLPSRFIIQLQEWFYNYIGGKNNYNNIDLSGLMTILFGFILVVLLIGFESFVIDHLSGFVKKILDSFLK